MKALSSLLTLSTLLFVAGCSSPPALDKRIDKIVSMYVDKVTNHAAERRWEGGSVDAIFHPDFNYLSLGTGYSGLESPSRVYEGTSLFIRTKIEEATEVQARVNLMKPPDTVEDAFFVKISYTLIAASEGDTLVMLPEPAQTFQYLVLSADPKDGSYKVIDFFPLSKSDFIGAQYFLDNFDSLSVDGEFKKLLAAKLGK
jgi:hypothetical protein